MNNNYTSPLAIELFETLLDSITDEQLNKLHDAITDYKGRYPRSLHSLMQQAFSGTTITLIEEEWAYRNQQEI